MSPSSPGRDKANSMCCHLGVREKMMYLRNKFRMVPAGWLWSDKDKEVGGDKRKKGHFKEVFSNGE